MLAEEQSRQTSARSQGPASSYWLIAKKGGGPTEVLTTGVHTTGTPAAGHGGGAALPVFGHREEAEMFLYLGGYGDGWRPRETTAGELVSVLCGPCASATGVALDPLPEVVAQGTDRLVSLGRKRFLGRLLADGGGLPRPGSPGPVSPSPSSDGTRAGRGAVA